MRISRACTGAFFCLLAGLTCSPLYSLRAEGELPEGSYSETSDNKLGIGMFSRWPIHVATTVQAGYDDNVNTTPTGKEGSGFVNANLALKMEIGTPRTSLTLSTNTGFNYFFNSVNNQYEPNLNLALTLTHKASARLTFDLTSYFAYQTEPNFESGLGTNRRNGNYFLTSNHLSASYLWLPRFQTRTAYNLSAVNYDDSAVGVFEDRVDQSFGNEFRFLIWPTTNLVAEYRFQVVTYQHEGEVVIPATFDPITGRRISPAIRLMRDSTTQFFLGGFDHAFNARLTGSFRGGSEFRDYTDSGTSSSPYFESTLSYRLGKDTSVTWTSHYGIEEGDVAQNPTRKSFRTGIQGQHTLSSRVTATLAMYYYHDDYSETQIANITNPGFTEDSFDVTLSLAYAINQHLGLLGGYSHSEVGSGQNTRDYSRNRIFAGLNFAF